MAEHFPHHAGHGLGLTHPEAPFFVRHADETLLAGDVVTLEPGLYVAGVGGIRIEHNYLITDDGLRAAEQPHHCPASTARPAGLRVALDLLSPVVSPYPDRFPHRTAKEGPVMFYQTEAKPQGWRAVAVFDDRREFLLYLGRSSPQMRQGFVEAFFEVLDEGGTRPRPVDRPAAALGRGPRRRPLDSPDQPSRPDDQQGRTPALTPTQSSLAVKPRTGCSLGPARDPRLCSLSTASRITARPGACPLPG